MAELKQAVWLRCEGNYAVVLAELGGRWHEIIRENISGFPDVTFSHIKEPGEVNNPDKLTKPKSAA